MSCGGGKKESVLYGEIIFLLTFLQITLVAHKHKFRNLNKKTLILYGQWERDLRYVPSVTFTYSSTETQLYIIFDLLTNAFKQTCTREM